MISHKGVTTSDQIYGQEFSKTKLFNPYNVKLKIRDDLHWRNIFLLLFFHAGFLASCIIYAFGLSAPIKWQTIAWIFVYGYGTSVGVTAGAHRLWTHRSYKAKLPMRIMLMIFYSAVGMNPIYYWVRDHRLHHKHSDTDGDPHNAKRGFFFAHVGWLMMRKHPEIAHRRKELDLSDLTADPVVMFNKKYAAQLVMMFCFVLPVAVAVIFWNETILHAVLTQCFIRYVTGLHCVWSVNSVAHFWGARPYNKSIKPVENLIVCLLTAGEGSHNYHHTFPWDYKASEWPYFCFNYTTFFIDGFSKIGWAHDMRQSSTELVQKTVERVRSKS